MRPLSIRWIYYALFKKKEPKKNYKPPEGVLSRFATDHECLAAQMFFYKPE